MSGLTASYGHEGPNAGGDPRVAELLKRSTEGHYQAMTAFEETLKSIADQGLAPWTASVSELTLLNRQWVDLFLWERATVTLDAFVRSGDFGDLAYRQSDDTCDLASAASMKTIGMQAELEQGKKPAMVRQAEALPVQSAGEPNCEAVWAVYETLYLRVKADFHRIEKFGVPASMQKVYEALMASFAPQEKKFVYVQRQWYASMTAENKLQLTRDVTPVVQQFYAVGQQLWTPYLLGRTYTDVVRVAAQSATIFGPLKLGFEPWILTDPDLAGQKVSDTASCQELAKFWQTLEDPAAAKALQDEIMAAVRMGSVTVLKGKSFKIAPWMPQYGAATEVAIGGQTFQPGDMFAVYPQGGQGGKRRLTVRSTGRL